MKKLPKISKNFFVRQNKSTYRILFLDFDGTLAPIVKRPELARLPAAGKRTLKTLAKQKDLAVVIISGRQLGNVKKKVGIAGLTYVGNHGLEMHGCGLRFLHPEAARAKKRLKQMAQHLKKAFQGCGGVWVEDKTYTLTIHYRGVKENAVLEAEKILRHVLQPQLQSGLAVLTQGKKVWEVRPRIAWNKGSAVKWLLAHFEKKQRRKALAMYLGDDVTDESAFRVLKGRGVTVKVTTRPRETSTAEFYLRSPADVHVLLNDLKDVFADA